MEVREQYIQTYYPVCRKRSDSKRRSFKVIVRFHVGFWECANCWAGTPPLKDLLGLTLTLASEYFHKD